MIRATRPADVVRYGVFGGPVPGNRAYPLAAIGTDSTVAMSKRDLMATVASLRSKDTYSLTLSHDRYVPAIVAARPRATVRCWEVSHLLVDSPDGTACHDVFGINVSRDSPTGRRARLSPPFEMTPPFVQLASSCGFTKYGEEALLAGPKVRFPGVSTQGMRSVKQIDEHDLFRPVQRLDAITGTVRPGNDRRPMAGGAGACRLAEPRVRIPSRRRGQGLGAGHPAWPLRDPHPDESSRRRRLHSISRHAQHVSHMGSQELVRSWRATIRARSRRI